MRSMAVRAGLVETLQQIPGLRLEPEVPLARFTRFAIGGPAELVVETGDPAAFIQAVRACRAAQAPFYVIGDGSNLVASDRGYRGVVLRFVARSLSSDGNRILSDAGASLQALIDYAIERGLAGLETLSGIPGSVGAAVYGNAGAYGQSISERVARVEVFDGEGLQTCTNSDCRFDYRESIFKRRKNWMILRAEFEMTPGDAAALRQRADEIIRVRNEKFPPAMRCAGSIFKNLYVAHLPPSVAAAIPAHAIREGKVASAYFLEQVGAKGQRRDGIQVASYHANLIYNAGGGTAAALRGLIHDLREQVRARFGIELEEEVQYLGDWD
jgi:UDP-N-acetylmuramate dehydrogenase